MDRSLVLDMLHPHYAISLPLPGCADLRPAPAVLLATLIAGNEDLQEAFDDPPRVLADPGFLAEVLKPETLRPHFERLVASGLRHAAPKVRDRILAAKDELFIVVAVTIFRISLPYDTSSFFPRRPKGKGSQVEPDAVDISADVLRAAYQLIAANHQDAFEMSWTRLGFALRVLSEESISELKNIAVGNRAGGAPDKGYKSFMKGLGE